MNKIILDSLVTINQNSEVDYLIKNDSKIVVNRDICCTINLFKDRSSYNIDIEVLDNAKLNLNIFGIDSNSNIDINLNNNSCINLCYSLISESDTISNIKVFHNGENSRSDIVNHVINKFDNEAKILVDLVVPKGIYGCSTIQDNKIINLGNGTGIILPNLLIDEFDTFAEHSAYISKFNKDEVFYLSSRGISEDEINKLLIKAFLINRITSNDEFKNLIINKIYDNI